MAESESALHALPQNCVRIPAEKNLVDRTNLSHNAAERRLRLKDAHQRGCGDSYAPVAVQSPWIRPYLHTTARR